MTEQQEAEVGWIRAQLPSYDQTRALATAALARVGVEIGAHLSPTAVRALAMAVVDAIDHPARLRGVDHALREADEAAQAIQQRVIAPLLGRTDSDALGRLAVHRTYLDGIQHVRAQQQQLLMHNARTWLGIEVVPLEAPDIVPLPDASELVAGRVRVERRAGTA
ncbi:hypothetical protein Ait01nite_020570 [Actinoplanes italicus]|uniref:Uncharacterized protein n=1 Tax=Actinoplanes italicus TaxID=113567 RepID=A0A2T0KPN6_9ACTN|nr:hypothetical protein [Actinoplanes italicus]PRX25545.1 hypothetical protein CLV67_101262 [Actinoplanes italicus]GIE29012.1 hypothetical protein Ait01nite_020570 [Actinoplanes italicus]